MNHISWINLVYIISCVLFAFGLKLLGSPETARKGNWLSALGMLLAVIATLTAKEIISFEWVLLGCVIGGTLGALVAMRAAMTQMPEMIALLHGFGGLASVFVDWSAYLNHPLDNPVTVIAIYVSVVVGGITFTGSIVAWGKLSERLPGKAILFPGQQVINAVVLAVVALLAIPFFIMPTRLSVDTGALFSARRTLGHSHRWCRHARGHLCP